MKQNKQTFASRAKKLINHYKRADFDKIEALALEKGLQKLQQEQEEYKAMNGLGNEQQDIPQFDGVTGSSFINPNINAFDFSNSLIPKNDIYKGSVPYNVYGSLLSNPNMGSGEFPVETAPVSMGNQLNMGSNQGGFYDWKQGINIPTQSTSTPATGGTSPYATSIAPSLISAGIGTLGNLYLASQQKKLPNIKLPRLVNEDISYAPAREMAQREAAKGSTKAKYNIGRGSRTRGEYLANTGLAESEISGKLGEILTASKQEEALVNANRRMGMNQANAEIAAKETLYNAEQTARTKAEKEAYIAAALQIPGQTSRDITSIQQQDALINALGEDYGWYMEKNPNAKWYQKKKTMKSKYKGNA